MRDNLKGAMKFAGDAFNVGHAWIIDIHVVLLQNSQSCYNYKDFMTVDGRICA